MKIMVQIIEITEDLLPKVPHVIELLYELYGAKTIGIFAVLVVLLIIVLVISGRRRKPVKSPPKSYAPTNKRDSF
jgi:hypothetical protein